MLVSIPADSLICFSHLAMVDDVTGLCGLIQEMNNCLLSPLVAHEAILLKTLTLQ